VVPAWSQTNTSLNALDGGAMRLRVFFFLRNGPHLPVPRSISGRHFGNQMNYGL